MCMNALPISMYVYYVCARCPKKSEEDFRFPGIVVFRWFATATWVVGLKPGSSERGASARNC